MAETPAPPAPDEIERERFELELEFVQCLASPPYLHFLAQQRYFDDPAFMAFLQYLTYWRQPQYAKFLMYPHCLPMLDALLSSKRFRSELLMQSFQEFIWQQQGYHWQHLRRDPLADALRAQGTDGGAATATTTAGAAPSAAESASPQGGGA